jgi:PAS domain S-box-containing protein
MATMALTMLPLGAVVSEWRRTTERLRTALAEQETLLQHRERAATAARASEARLEGMILAAMDAIISVDERQRIVVFNAAAERMFRCPAAQAVGRPLDRFIPPRVRDAHRRHVQEFGRRGATARRMGALGELTALRADGEEFPIEASISQAEAGGQKLFTVILRDITERKRTEADLRQALAEKDMLLREVHHRVKNNFQMLCDLLYLQATTQEGRQAQDVLEDTYGRIFALAKVHEDLHQSLASGDIRLAEYLGRLVRGLQSVHAEVQIGLDAPDTGLTLDVDRAIYTGLIVNELLTNAVKHASRDGKAGEVTVSVRTRGDALELRVRDTGPGLPADLELARAPSLGLRIVHILAGRLKATVQVENTGGACFTIRFPLQAPA